MEQFGKGAGSSLIHDDLVLSNMEIDCPIKMRITSQQVCPVCNKKGGYEVTKGGLICQCGKFSPTLLEVVFVWNRRRVRITTNKRGERISGHLDAIFVLQEIAHQITQKTFDPNDWKRHNLNQLIWPNYIDSYLERQRLRLGNDGRATYERKRTTAKQLRLLSKDSIKEIRSAQVADFFTNPALASKYAPKTIRDMAQELRFIFNEAVNREVISKAPLVPKIHVPEKPIEWMTPDQQAQALNYIPEVHRPIFEFLFIYGCRVSEALALCWDAIDRGKGEVAIKRTFSRKRLIDFPKTRRPNIQPLHADFEEVLAKLNPGVGKTPVFVHPNANTDRNPLGFYSGEVVNRIWRFALKDAGLEHIRLQNAARHSLGMQMAQAGVPEYAIEGQLGHTSPTHTRKYVRADHRILRDARKKLISFSDNKITSRSG